MNLDKLTSDILEFNNSNPDEAKNIINSDKPYRGNQHDLDTFINTIQYIEYKKGLKKKTRIISQKELVTYDNPNDIMSILSDSQYKKQWSRLDVYSKKNKISEYIEKEVKKGNLNQELMKEYIAHLFRLIEQKKLNKKGNIEYDADNGIIINISTKLFEGIK